MINGINRATNHYSYAGKEKFEKLIECVFISYQRKDEAFCRRIANYLMNLEIDVYFDLNDEGLNYTNQRQNPDRIVKSIKKGINKSSHMLCVVSPSTIDSYWVPWEIGYGYEKIDLAVLTLSGIKENDLPDYLKTTEVLRTRRQFDGYIKKISGEARMILESREETRYYSNNHSLSDILD